MPVCKLVTDATLYDRWVVPHQLLPAMAVVLGINWIEVVAIMYAWETLEASVGCSNDVFATLNDENIYDSLISDPFQCFMGVLVARVLLNVCDMDESVVSGGRWVAYPWTVLFILPAVPFIVSDGLEWLYVPIWFFMWVFTISVNKSVPQNLGVWVSIYAVTLAVSVFLLEDLFNSFYVGLLVGVVNLMTLLIYKNI